MAVTDPPSSSEVERAVRLAAERIEPDRIGAEIAGVLHRDVSALNSDPESRAETQRASTATIQSFLHALRRGEAFTEVPAPAEDLAAARALARRGPSVRPLLRLCSLAHAAFLDEWDKQIAFSGLSPEATLAATRRSHQLGFAWVDSLTEQLSDEFERERDRWVRTAEAMRAETVRSLISGEPFDADAASGRLGYELRRHHVGLVLWTRTAPGEATAHTTLEGAAQEIAAQLGGGEPLTVPVASAYLWAWTGFDEPPTRRLDSLPRYRSDDVSVSIGEPGHGFAGFRETHRDALDAAQVAMLSERRPGVTVRYHAVELGALLVGNIERTRRFIRHELGALAVDDDQQNRLRATLKVYLEENASRVAVSRRLGIHSNTVANRVRTCQELLGRDVGERVVELQVALTLAETLGPAVLDPPD